MRKTALTAAAAVALFAPHVAYGQAGLATGTLGGATGTATSTATGALGAAGSAITGATGTLGGAVGGVGSTLGGTVGGVGGTVGGAVGGVGGTVGGAVGGVGGLSGGLGGASGGSGGGGATGLGSGAGPSTTASLPSGAGVPSRASSGLSNVASVSLPAALAPCDDVPRRRDTSRQRQCGPRYTALFAGFGQVSGTREDLESFGAPLSSRPGTPQQVVQNCRDSIVAAALPYGVVRVDAASAGPMQSARGGFAAPVEFRIVYSRQGGLETRQATINCRLNTAGRVISAA